MEIKQLSKKIEQQVILENINLTVPEGVIYAIVGRNGSGKTSLFRTIAGHYLPDQGMVVVEGTNAIDEPSVKEKIFYIDTQFHSFDYMTPKVIGEYYEQLYTAFDKELFKKLLKAYGLPNLRYQKFSKGMQGLLNIILATCSNCKYLLLDEPLDGLDVIVRKQCLALLMDIVSDGSRTIIISSHNLSELEKIVDHVAFLKNHTTSSEINLEEQKQTAQKLQLVFKQKVIPKVVKNKGHILSVQGRVIIAIFDQYDDAIEEELQSQDPLLMEQLPLTLEDLFIEKFTSKDQKKEDD